MAAGSPRAPGAHSGGVAVLTGAILGTWFNPAFMASGVLSVRAGLRSGQALPIYLPHGYVDRQNALERLSLETLGGRYVAADRLCDGAGIGLTGAAARCFAVPLLMLLTATSMQEASGMKPWARWRRPRC